MQWESFSQFIDMGGYGFYVWGAYGMTALLIAAEIVVLVSRGRTLRRGAGRIPEPAGPRE